MCGLDDRALAALGDAHRERSLVVRSALLDRLARATGDQGEDDKDDTNDRDDPDDKGDDAPVDDRRDKGRRKKSEKAAEPDNTFDEQDEAPAATYEDQLRAAANAILAAGARDGGEPPPESLTRRFPTDADVYEAERAAGMRYRSTSSRRR